MLFTKIAFLPSRMMLQMVYHPAPSKRKREAKVEAQLLTVSRDLPSRASVLELERRIERLDQQLNELLATQSEPYRVVYQGARIVDVPSREPASHGARVVDLPEAAPKNAHVFETTTATLEPAMRASESKPKRAAEMTNAAPAQAREGQKPAQETATNQARIIEAPSEMEAEALPLRGYDRRRVPEIIEQLPALGEDELEEVRDYEQRHKNHRGVLEAIEQELVRRQPLPDYASMTAPEIIEQLATLDVDTARAVWSFEDMHAKRVTVMRAAERRIADLLPIPDYPGLSVVHVVAQLKPLADEDLEKVRRYEEAHANRVGVLRAIDEELARRVPLADYRELTVPEVLERLETMNADKLREVQAYEAEHAHRVTLLREIDERLSKLAEQGIPEPVCA